MIVNIVACGNSASEWYKTSCDLSIGVNDCEKWGHPVDQLIVINSPRQFTKERQDIIKATKAKVFSHSDSWHGILNYERLRLQSFSKHLKKGHVYSSKTSPFVAMSHAFNQGATDIILHGVDLVDHPTFHPGNKLHAYELRQIEKFARMLGEQECRVWLGKDFGALGKFLRVWPWNKETVIDWSGALVNSVSKNKEYVVTVDRIGLTDDDAKKFIEITKK